MINWMSFFVMIMGISLGIASSLNENLRDLLFIGGMMFGMGLTNLEKKK